jgi:protein-S-isoprenylcysteine O-methyltransferase Ste14
MSGDFGLWPLVVINTAIFVVFAVSFYRPRNNLHDWTVMGGFTAFLVALFTEMYGVPLTVYLLSGWLGSRFPQLQADHAGGHLWNDLVGWQGDPHSSPFHLASSAFIIAGFMLIAVAWSFLYRAARQGQLAVAGPYAWLRHPQYLGFIVIMLGFLLQWPTIPTLVMFPILAWVYARLARREESVVATTFGAEWSEYVSRVNAFVPKLPRRGAGRAPSSLPPPPVNAPAGGEAATRVS